jgi:hypothetical protein
MEKEFIPYEQALALKELMISVECMAYYNNGILKIHQDGFRNCKNIDFIAVFNDEKLCAAPLYQQAFRWFREKYKIDSVIIRSFSMTNSYHYNIVIDQDYGNDLQSTSIPNRTYEEAELACLIKLIEITKRKIT